MKISVIIPAHNSSQTIANAIESTGVTTNNDIEVIVITNGCTDNTREIVEKYSKNCSNVVLANSAPGVSNARNKGLEQAQAEWVTFLDADDVFVSGAIDKYLYQLQNNKENLLCFDYFSGRNKIELFNDQINSCSKQQLLTIMMDNATKYLTVWNKLFRKSIIKKYHLRFDTDLEYSEDSKFLLEYMRYINKVNFVNEITYRYNNSNLSTVRTYKSTMLDSYVSSTINIFNAFKSYPEFKEGLNGFVIAQFNLIMVHSVFIYENGLNLHQQIKEMIKVYNLFVFRHAATRIGVDKSIKPRFLPICLCKIKWYLLAAMIYKLRVLQNSKK